MYYLHRFFPLLSELPGFRLELAQVWISFLRFSIHPINRMKDHHHVNVYLVVNYCRLFLMDDGYELMENRTIFH